jgi:integrase
MPRLKAPPPIVPTLDPQDEEKILEALSEEDRAIFLVALDGLVRLGDVLSLRWSDVMADGMLRIRHDKTGKTHTVPLSQRAQAALGTIQPNPLDRSARVFAMRGGNTRQHGATYTQMLKRVCKRLVIPFGRAQGGITFHGATRHTGATRLTASGVDLRTVQELGGWSNISMLQRYVHPSTAVLRSAVEKIGAST